MGSEVAFHEEKEERAEGTARALPLTLLNYYLVLGMVFIHVTAAFSPRNLYIFIPLHRTNHDGNWPRSLLNIWE